MPSSATASQLLLFLTTDEKFELPFLLEVVAPIYRAGCYYYPVGLTEVLLR